MNARLCTLGALVALSTLAACAQPGPGTGPGADDGRYGPGWQGGMGPGMMGSSGGPGMMGSGGGPGMGGGRGMMGSEGMGPGMMSGEGMGPGMMGGGMGGMMAYGDRSLWALDLDQAQREKILAIQRELSRKRWDLMGRMHDQRYQLGQAYAAGKDDEAAERRAYQAMADAHKEMFEAALKARKDIDAVLTPAQREQLRRQAPGR